MSKAYSALGGFFEYLNDDCGYQEWSQYLIKRLQSLGVSAGACGVDAGCGNGYFTRALQRAGYSVLGVDISSEMLNKATELSRKEGLRPKFIQGDITALELNFKPDFIVAVNDCLNYVPQNKLAKTFSRIYKLLKKVGAFIFDISSENKLKNVIANNVFAEDREDISYTWFNTLQDDRVLMDITVFTRRNDGLYERRDESHTQYIHCESEVVSALQAAGFSVECEGHLGGDKSQRINFICKKQ
ncbi:MAG: methyltransferase domain-containing protein [Clostridia bacterium]|nr:methyltransferase domain-containing protein [Clostridia bacterium]